MNYVKLFVIKDGSQIEEEFSREYVKGAMRFVNMGQEDVSSG